MGSYKLGSHAKCEPHITFVVDNRISTDSDVIADKLDQYFIDIGYNFSGENIQTARPFREYLKDESPSEQ